MPTPSGSPRTSMRNCPQEQEAVRDCIAHLAGCVPESTTPWRRLHHATYLTIARSTSAVGHVRGLCAVTSTDGMTADFYCFEPAFLGRVATRSATAARALPWSGP